MSQRELAPLRILVEAYFDAQEVRVRTNNRLKDYERKHREVPEYLPELLSKSIDYEETVEKMLSDEVKQLPIYRDCLKKIKGVKETLSVQILSLIGDISKFDMISKLWSYAGLNVIIRCAKCEKRLFNNDGEKSRWVQKMVNRLRESHAKRIVKKWEAVEPFNEDEARDRVERWTCKCKNPQPKKVAPTRRKGEMVEWSVKLRKVCYNIATSILKTNSKYRKLYDEFKEEYNKRVFTYWEILKELY